jgi:hypothetical protein
MQISRGPNKTSLVKLQGNDFCDHTGTDEVSILLMHLGNLFVVPKE